MEGGVPRPEAAMKYANKVRVHIPPSSGALQIFGHVIAVVVAREDVEHVPFDFLIVNADYPSRLSSCGEARHDVLEAHELVGQASGHGWRHPQRLVDATEILEHKVERQRVDVALKTQSLLDPPFFRSLPSDFLASLGLNALARAFPPRSSNDCAALSSPSSWIFSSTFWDACREVEEFAWSAASTGRRTSEQIHAAAWRSRAATFAPAMAALAAKVAAILEITFTFEKRQRGQVCDRWKTGERRPATAPP